jgi:predicted lysophospholipase L1 biosynthesis ABC-type transport system permease subunit
VVVANEWYAEQWFPGEDAIGKRGGFNDAEIVGIVRNVTTDNVRWRMPVLYRLCRPDEARLAPAIVVRAAASIDPESLSRPLEAAVRQVNPRLFAAVRTAGQALDRSIARERMVATASALFGAIGLVLAAMGLFGVAAAGVARRTSELGLRIALGAGRWDVVREALRGTAIVFGAGLAAGVAIVIVASRVLDHAVSQLLIGLRPGDWAVVAAAVGAMLIAAIAASVLPALRAARVDPLLAIRYDHW